jgi:putative heme-binding domain-containing protein
MNSIDRGSLKPGDPTHGQLVVETKGACLACHRINNQGSRKAPDLSRIGSDRSAGSLERSLLDPSSQMWPINRPVHIVAKDVKMINGRLNRSDLRELTVSTRSNMPSCKDELTSDELADVVTYLLSLKGQ